MDNDGDSALIVSAGWGNLNCIELLLAASADIEIVSKNGRTALLAAALSNQPNALELLIRAGCNVNHTDIHGQTASLQQGRATWTASSCCWRPLLTSRLPARMA